MIERQRHYYFIKLPIEACKRGAECSRGHELWTEAHIAGKSITCKNVEFWDYLQLLSVKYRSAESDDVSCTTAHRERRINNRGWYDVN